MPKPQPTARECLINYALSATPNEVTFEKAEQLAHAYEAEHRDHVLTEAAAMLRAHCPQHTGGDTAFMTCQCPAAVELERTARTSPAKPRPVALCELPHPVAADTWCALPIEHPGWHEDAAGDRWPNLLLAARTASDAP